MIFSSGSLAELNFALFFVGELHHVHFNAGRRDHFDCGKRGIVGFVPVRKEQYFRSFGVLELFRRKAERRSDIGRALVGFFRGKIGAERVFRGVRHGRRKHRVFPEGDDAYPVVFSAGV